MKLRKLLCMLLCVLMLLQYAAFPAFAEEINEGTEPAEVVSEKEAVIRSACPVTGLPDNSELFSYYVEQQLYGYEFSTFGTKAREQLNPIEQQIYDVLKAKIEDVAARGGSAVFELSNVPGLKTTFTKEDLGVNRIDDPNLMTEEKLAIVLGTEGDGLASHTIADCDYTVCIPMSHGVDSLNVAAASAVAFWQLGRV